LHNAIVIIATTSKSCAGQTLNNSRVKQQQSSRALLLRMKWEKQKKTEQMYHWCIRETTTKNESLMSNQLTSYEKLDVKW